MNCLLIATCVLILILGSTLFAIAVFNRKLKNYRKALIRAVETRLAPDDSPLVIEAFEKAAREEKHEISLPVRDIILHKRVEVSMPEKRLNGSTFVLDGPDVNLTISTKDGPMRNVTISGNVFYDNLLSYCAPQLSNTEVKKIKALIVGSDSPHSLKVDDRLSEWLLSIMRMKAINEELWKQGIRFEPYDHDGQTGVKWWVANQDDRKVPKMNISINWEN